MHYFGEKLDKQECNGACDNCPEVYKEEVIKKEVQDDVADLINAVN